MSRYQITGIIYIHIGMYEWAKRYTWEFPHKHRVFTAPDEHMAIIIQLHIMSIQPASKAAEHQISSELWPVSEKKTEATNAYFIKNTKGEGEKRRKAAGGIGCGRGHSHKQSEGLGGVLWVYKIGLKWPGNGNHLKTSVSLSAWERQRTRTWALKLYITRIVV